MNTDDELTEDKLNKAIFGDNGLVGKILKDYREALDRTAQAEPEHGPGAPDGRKNPKIPKQGKRLNEWRAIWQRVKPEWERGRKGYIELSNWLTGLGLPCSDDRLADIIRAGEAGLLDLP